MPTHEKRSSQSRMMQSLWSKRMALLAAFVALLTPAVLLGETVPVRHIEGTALGFLVLRNLDGKIIANGELQQIVMDREKGLIVSDLRFRFKDGSSYEDIAKFTQNGTFRLVSDQVVQKGPSFKQDVESSIDVASGNIAVITLENGKKKETHKHLDLPPDLCNGFLSTLLKNVDPSRETTLSMVAVSKTPRLVKVIISPEREKSFKIGLITRQAQHYRVEVKIEGLAGVVAPFLGKQPPNIHVWIVKSEAPTFLEFEGPLSEDGPVWRMELAAPEADTARTNPK